MPKYRGDVHPELIAIWPYFQVRSYDSVDHKSHSGYNVQQVKSGYHIDHRDRCVVIGKERSRPHHTAPCRNLQITEH